MKASFALMNGNTNPRAAQLEHSKDFKRDKATCDNCDKTGIWFHYDNQVACDKCLQLKNTNKDTIAAAFAALFNIEEAEEVLIIPLKTDKSEIEKLRKELKERSGKLYQFERRYVDAARKANRLMQQAHEAKNNAIEASNKLEVERKLIAQLEQKIIDMRIGL